jgi:hypothetical protein
MLSFGLIELILIFGVALGIGVWQLWSVSRSQAEDRTRDEQD